jgi:acyl-CoA synthetase (NDP forming)
VIRTNTLAELLDAARLLVDQPLPTGNRLGIVGNAGGLNILACDAADAAGLTVPDAGGANPIDLGAAAAPAAMRDSITAMAGSRQVDNVLAVFVATLASDVPAMLSAIGDGADAAGTVPMAAVIVGLPDAPTTLGRRRIPVYGLPEPAVHAMGHANWYAAWRREPLGQRPDLAGIDHERAGAVVADAGAGWQPPSVTAALLGCYGIRALPGEVVTTLDDAVAAAFRLGFPVALKAADPAIVHKTERGAVRLDLTDPFAVRDAYAHIAAALGKPQPPVLVQPMHHGGVELVVGVVHDHQFGSLVMLGLGGVLTDLLGDRTFRLLPVTDVDAGRMWRTLRGAPLLTGYRGSSPVDTDALQDLLARVGRLAEDFPEVAELDLNPVLAMPDGVVVVDAKLRLVPVGTEPDATVRALAEPAPAVPS